MASESVSFAMSIRSRRTTATSSFVPGFYRTLNSDVKALSSTSAIQSNTLALSTSGDQLPDGCFLVERVITTRKHKVTSDHNNKINKQDTLKFHRERESIWFFGMATLKKRHLGSLRRM